MGDRVTSAFFLLLFSADFCGCFASSRISDGASAEFDSGPHSSTAVDAGVDGSVLFRDGGAPLPRRTTMYVVRRDPTGLAASMLSVLELDPVRSAIANEWSAPSPRGDLLSLGAWVQRDGRLRLMVRLGLPTSEQTYDVYVLDPSTGEWETVSLSSEEDRVVVSTHPTVVLSAPSPENDFVVLTLGADPAQTVRSTGVEGRARAVRATGWLYAIVEDGEVIAVDDADLAERARFEIPFRSIDFRAVVDPSGFLIVADDTARTLVRSDWRSITARGPSRLFDREVASISVRVDGMLAVVDAGRTLTLLSPSFEVEARADLDAIAGPNWVALGWFDPS
jgi:hypothetical protein